MEIDYSILKTMLKEDMHALEVWAMKILWMSLPLIHLTFLMLPEK